MWVRGIDLGEVVNVEEGGEGVRITFVGGERKFVGGEGGREVLERWRMDRRLMGMTEEDEK
jgi:hypothetical protein